MSKGQIGFFNHNPNPCMMYPRKKSYSQPVCIGSMIKQMIVAMTNGPGSKTQTKVDGLEINPMTKMIIENTSQIPAAMKKRLKSNGFLSDAMMDMNLFLWTKRTAIHRKNMAATKMKSKQGSKTFWST